MKIFDPKKGGEIVLPLPSDKIGPAREVMVVAMPPCEISRDINVDTRSLIATSATIRGEGAGGAVKHDLASHDLTALILIERESADREGIHGNDVVLDLRHVVKFRVNVEVTQPYDPQVTLELEVIGVPQTYASVIYGAMKK